MGNEEFSALQFGKLMAAVEGLVSTMQEIQNPPRIKRCRFSLFRLSVGTCVPMVRSWRIKKSKT